MANDLFFVNVFPPNDRQQLDFDYPAMVKRVVDYSIDMDFKYTLITIGDKRLDPWVLGQHALAQNSAFSPLLAVNPFYQHPVHVVKKIISLKTLYQSRLAINIVAGSFFGELKALNDTLTFQDRSARLVDFFEAMRSLIEKQKNPHTGPFYTVSPAEVFPPYQFDKFDFFVSGSHFSAMNSCPEAHFVQSIRPLEEMQKAPSEKCGLGIGLCARPTRTEALAAIKTIYPDDRKGEMLFHLSMANNETPWNQWFRNYLQKNTAGNIQERPDYYLKPMTNFWCSSPFVVGSYEEVAEKISSYGKLGYKFFILDFAPDEAPHVKKVLELIRKK